MDKFPFYGDSTAPVEVVSNVTEWLIDVGPFYDRFGTSRMAILKSTHPDALAIREDVSTRKWIDLKRADVASSIDQLMAIDGLGVTAAMKDKILNTPVTAAENLALRKLYFS